MFQAVSEMYLTSVFFILSFAASVTTRAHFKSEKLYSTSGQ